MRNQSERPGSRLPKNQLLWLALLVFTALLVGLSLLLTSWRRDVAQLEATLTPLSGLLTATPVPLLGEDQLALATLQAQQAQVELLLGDLSANRRNWAQAVSAIRAYNQQDISLSQLTQNGDELLIEGQAVDETAVIAYADALEASGQFRRVVVQSVVVLPEPTETAVVQLPTNTPTATSTPRPTTIPKTPTPDLRDEFEWDDNHPRPIFIGAPQLHNFFPNFDVDNVTFLAKANRTYQIRTSSLAPGVDTFLTVTYGETTLTNDDAQAGTLASQITITAPGQDTEVHVRISNRGPYGADKMYQIVVQEVVLTPTPTSTPATPIPPTATPSPTPDLRDTFEPDDSEPKQIAVGELQFRNFFPNGDIDKLFFLTKNQRHYQVSTSNLSLGVDTVLQVEVDGRLLENDDYEPLGSGNLASSVCFSAESDATAVVTVSTTGGQYAPDKNYGVTVVEVPPLTPNVSQLSLGPVPTDGFISTQTIQIESTEVISWTAVTSADWLFLSSESGTTPDTLDVDVDLTGLAPGLYETEIVLGWADVCRFPIGVMLQVDPASSERLRPRGHIAKPARQSLPVEFVILVEFDA